MSTSHGRASRLAGALLLVLIGGVVGLAAPAQASGLTDEDALAQRFAPVVMLVRQDERCGPGEPYRPSEVSVLFDNPTVALRGPWSTRDLVAVGPSERELAQGLPGYALDYPGDALRPGCAYERWARDQWREAADPVVYARVATQAGVTDRIALQYYFFYPFNDYNNKHEGDWERIQLEFAAPDAATARREDLRPTRVVYAQHYGSEFAVWGEDKLELVDGTRPVVYVSAGSHAAQFSAGVYLGNSATTGFGCDVTVGPHEELRPQVLTIPSDRETAIAAYPWVAYEGHWGEVGPRRFYEGPTGPSQKVGWRKPFDFSASARSDALVVPGLDVAGSGVMEFYCAAVARGSDLYRTYVARSPAILAGLALLLVVAVGLVRRSGGGSDPLPVRRHRSAAGILSAGGRMLRRHAGMFALASAPAVLATGLGAVLTTRAMSHDLPRAVSFIGDALSAVALVWSAAAITVLLRSVGAGSRPGIGAAYVEASRRLLRSLPALVVAGALLQLLLGSLVLAPLALLLLGAWSLLVAVVVEEDVRGLRALTRSVRLAVGSLRTTLPVLVVMLLLLGVVGTLLATLLFVITPLPLVVLNVVPPLALALVWPGVVLLAAYAYASAVHAGPEDPEHPVDPDRSVAAAR